jgi:heterodisulfide reductase subunit A
MLKERYPKCEVYILYRDVRTYGFKEEWYRRARERGVIFIRYDEKLKPEVSASNKHLTILVFDSLLKEKLLIGANLLILSTAILPHPQNGKLAEILKIPLTEDGFFLEAHPKLRPLELPSDGLFVCGLSHSPKMIDESISQSLGAASRASTILSKGELEAEGTIAIVNKEKCIACLTCMRVCPYNVPSLNEEGVIEIEPLMCHGCGTCTSECPAKALELQNYLDKGLIAKVEAIIL